MATSKQISITGLGRARDGSLNFLKTFLKPACLEPDRAECNLNLASKSLGTSRFSNGPAMLSAARESSVRFHNSDANLELMRSTDLAAE